MAWQVQPVERSPRPVAVLGERVSHKREKPRSLSDPVTRSRTLTGLKRPPFLLLLEALGFLWVLLAHSERAAAAGSRVAGG